MDIKNPQVALDKLNSCLKDIRSWMIKNKLKINDSKTEFIILASPHSHKEYLSSELNVTVGNSLIHPSLAVRNLGVMFDTSLKMDAHVTSICKSANFHLRNIGSIRSCLTDSAAAQLVHSLITSRLTIATHYWLVCPRIRFKNCNGYKIMLLVWLREYENLNTYHQCYQSFTGYQYQKE